MPDRALRRLVARLAELDEADRLAILGSLSAEQAAQIQALLGDYTGIVPAPEVVSTSRWAGLGLSPALVQRLETGGGELHIPVDSGGGTTADLTDKTLSTLRRLATDLGPAPSIMPEAQAAARPGLLTRLGILGGRW